MCRAIDALLIEGGWPVIYHWLRQRNAAVCARPPYMIIKQRMQLDIIRRELQGSQAIANRTIYTRTYSTYSVRQLVSGKGSKGDPLSDTALLYEFQNHASLKNSKPTALVSCSDRIVDTLKRAFDKHYQDRERSADIWIAFIEVLPNINARIHSAKKLAEKCTFEEPDMFSHEVVFEWAIPEKSVVHEVSLQTLMKRGLEEQLFLHPSTADVRSYTARGFQLQGPWEIGIALGCFAKKFGARAPLEWISHRLFRDCVRAKIVCDEVVDLRYAHGHTETVDFQFFCDLDDGISTSLYEWWLADIDFSQDYTELKEWKDMIEDSMTGDLIEFWETWRDFDSDGRIHWLSAKEEVSYNKSKNKLFGEHEKKRLVIEAEALKLGL